MLKHRIAVVALSLPLIACATAAPDQPRPDGNPPWSALTSSPAALKVAFEEVCLPAILEGKPVETLAIQRGLIAVNAKTAGFSGDVKAWRLASYGPVYVAAWADGTCSVTLQRGDSAALKQQALDAVTAGGIPLRPGEARAAQADGINQAYCGPAPNPLVISIITPADRKSRRGAIFINLFHAHGQQPGFCSPAKSDDRPA